MIPNCQYLQIARVLIREGTCIQFPKVSGRKTAGLENLTNYNPPDSRIYDRTRAAFLEERRKRSARSGTAGMNFERSGMATEASSRSLSLFRAAAAAKCYRCAHRDTGLEAVPMNRAALFVAGGIPRCRLSPETFITARRPLGITNVFDGNDCGRFSARRGASRNRKFILAKESRNGGNGSYSSCYTTSLKESERTAFPSFHRIAR